MENKVKQIKKIPKTNNKQKYKFDEHLIKFYLQIC